MNGLYWPVEMLNVKMRYRSSLLDTSTSSNHNLSLFGFFRDFRVIFIWLKMNKLRIKPGQKPEKGGGFRRSTAGGRELGLEARPPARLICWRKLFSTGKSGLLPGVWEGDGRCMSKDAGRRSRLCPRKNHPEIPEEAEFSTRCSGRFF